MLGSSSSSSILTRPLSPNPAEITSGLRSLPPALTRRRTPRARRTAIPWDRPWSAGADAAGEQRSALLPQAAGVSTASYLTFQEKEKQAKRAAPFKWNRARRGWRNATGGGGGGPMHACRLPRAGEKNGGEGGSSLFNGRRRWNRIGVLQVGQNRGNPADNRETAWG